MASKQEQLSNDNLQLTISKEEGCQVELQVIVNAQAIEATYLKAVKDVKKNISLPGFRKGKAPDALVEKNYASHVEERFKEFAVNTALREAIALSNLHPLSSKKIQHTINHCSKEKGADFLFQFEIQPEIPDISPENITLKKVDKEEVPQEQVDELVAKMQSYHMNWETIEGRKAEENDFADLDIEAVDEKKMIVTDKRFELTEKVTGRWLIDLVAGLAVGESKEGMSQADTSLDEEAQKNFKPSKCKVSLKGLFKGTLPPLDDDFAKKVGVNSVPEMRTNILLKLNQDAEVAAHKKLKDQIDDYFNSEVSDFDLPKSLLDSEKSTKVQEKTNELKRSGLTDEDIKKQDSSITEGAEKEAKKALKMYFLIQKFAADKKIQVSEDELRQSVFEHLNQLGPLDKLPPNAAEHFINELKSICYMGLMNEKVKDYIIKHAKIA